MSFRNKITLLLSTLLLTGGVGMAQTAEPSQSEEILSVMIFAMITLSLVALVLAFTVFVMVRQWRTAEAKEGVEDQASKPSSWQRFWLAINDLKPVEKEKDIDMGHDYDGIRELDNNLPPWWKWGFYISIVWAFGYMIYYHASSAGWSSEKEYNTEMAIAAEEKAAYLAQAADLVDENSVELLTDGAALIGGKKTYQTLCAVCHGAEGQGGTGPNMTDAYWIHGGSIKDVFSTIKYGVTEKGMISWEEQLTPREMHEVASYILSLQGTNPPNPKEPQGELYESEAAPADTTDGVAMR